MAWMARIAENEIRDRADYQDRQRRDAARRVPLEEAAEEDACHMMFARAMAALTLKLSEHP